MPTYSCDLRERIIAAREDGHSAEEVARLFRVSRRSVERYWKTYQTTGAVEPKQRGGYRRSCLEGHDGRLRAWIGEKKDLTLAQLRERIAGDLGIKVGNTALFRQTTLADLRTPIEAGHLGVEARLIDKDQPLNRPVFLLLLPALTGGLEVLPVLLGGAQRFFYS